MPIPSTTLLADLRYVFACIHDREPRGGCGYYDSTGHYTPVTNLRWLRAHSSEVHDLFVSTYRYKSCAMGGGPPYGRTNHDGFDAIMAARLTNGRVYVTTWQSRTLLHDWLARSNKWRGRPVHWDCVAYIVDSRDYHRMMWEWRKRCERERKREAEREATEPRYQARYRDGYYVVIDTHTGDAVPPPAGHYKRYQNGYLWDYAAVSMAEQYNRTGV